MFEIDMVNLVSQLQGLWPKYDFSAERQAMLRILFREYTAAQAAEAAITWAAEHPDSWPRWSGIVELLRADSGEQYDPSKWTIADEVQLRHMMIQELDLADRLGKAARSEDEVARDRIGKNPSQEEREDAWARLNRQIDAGNAERMRNGSSLRCSHYPEARYYYVDERGNEILPPTTRAAEPDTQPRKGQFRSRVLREWFERKHGAQGIGELVKKTVNP